MNKLIFEILQVFLSAFLVVLVLLQSSKTGLSSAVSGLGTFYRTRRGMEKVVFFLTIAISILFVVNSVLLLTIL